MFSMVYPDSGDEFCPVQQRRPLYLYFADYERLRSTDFALAYVAFRFLRCPHAQRHNVDRSSWDLKSNPNNSTIRRNTTKTTSIGTAPSEQKTFNSSH